MSNDLISREALKKALKSNCKPELCHDYGTNWCGSCCRTNDFEDLIDNAPTVEERPQGEWICITKSTFPQYQPDEYKCSECSGPSSIEYYFCPHCGADMRGNNK